MKIIKIGPIIFLIGITILQLSCDERTPTEDSSSNYTMTMIAQPVAGDDISELRLFNIKELPELAFDCHQKIVSYYLL